MPLHEEERLFIDAVRELNQNATKYQKQYSDRLSLSVDVNANNDVTSSASIDQLTPLIETPTNSISMLLLSADANGSADGQEQCKLGLGSSAMNDYCDSSYATGTAGTDDNQDTRSVSTCSTTSSTNSASTISKTAQVLTNGIPNRSTLMNTTPIDAIQHEKHHHNHDQRRKNMNNTSNNNNINISAKNKKITAVVALNNADTDINDDDDDNRIRKKSKR